MTFNSFLFPLFFVVVLFVHAHLRHRAQNHFLVAASWFFYGWWDWRFLGLIVGSTALDFVCGLALEHFRTGGRRKIVLATSLTLNLAVLGFFKYFGFFADSAVAVLDAMGFAADRPTLEILLPVGISFYTFQSMSYSVDVYRRRIPACRRWDEFALYIAFFPQLVAGPIERAERLLPQIAAPRVLTRQRLRLGVWWILLGFVQKLVVADNLAVLVPRGFDNPAEAGFVGVWISAVAFAFQIYGDFAGYTSIARGTACLLGFDLMRNFRQPYFATGPGDFWRRWHISLSEWIRDYLYIPLGGSRRGAARTSLNLMLVMGLAGLWHGAAWTFVFWGLLHGAWLVAARLSAGLGLALPRPVAAVLTFHAVLVGWIFFRADSASDAWGVLRGAVSSGGEGGGAALVLLAAFCLPMLLVDLVTEAAGTDRFFLRLSKPLRWAACALMLALICLAGATRTSTFVYFQF